MKELNLPPFDIRLKQQDGKSWVFDPLRRKWVVLTPEEWVRQHFVNYLVQEKGYPASRMANEYLVELNGRSLRSDTVFFDRQMRPMVVAEYKAPSVAITQKVFEQILRYCIVLQPRFVIVSNGLNHYCCEISGGEATFLADIPLFAPEAG